MSQLRQYEIQLMGLKNGHHEYTYQLDDAFFTCFQNAPVSEGSLGVTIDLEKTDRHLVCQYKINGHVTLICDRSLDSFKFDIELDDQLIFKYGDEFQELSEELITIPHETEKLNMGQYMFEFICIAIPMKRLHPRFELDESEDDELVYQSQPKDNESKDDEQIDPRWEALKNLKN